MRWGEKNWKVCETIDELIRSKDFTKAFNIVLKQRNPLNQEFYIWVLKKIQINEKITDNEKKLFLELLNDNWFKDIAKEVYGKIEWFSLEEAKEFLEKYPVSKIIEELKNKTEKLYKLLN